MSGDEFDPRGYDRENGQGAAAKVVESIRNSQAVEFKKGVPATELEKAATAKDGERAVQLSEESAKKFSFESDSSSEEESDDLDVSSDIKYV